MITTTELYNDEDFFGNHSKELVPSLAASMLAKFEQIKMMVKLEKDKFKKNVIKRFPNNYHICRRRPNDIRK